MNDNLPGGQPQRSGWMAKTALTLAVLALILAGAALYLVLREELAPEPETFQYGGQTLVAEDR